MIDNTFDNFYKGKRVLVTGHTGFKGSWLSIWLHELGAEVIGVGQDPYNSRDNYCLRYYEKPYDYAEFKKSVVEALEYTTPKKAKDFYYYKDDGVIYSIKTKNIVYFQTNNRITYIKCKNGKVMPTPYKSNKKILLELNSKKFLRCSNNTIVNAEYIEGIDKSNRYVMLVDGFGTLEIGPKLKKKFLEDFFKC